MCLLTKIFQVTPARSRSFKITPMSRADIHCRRKYIVTFVPLMSYSTSNICVTLKSGLRVVQDHWKWRGLETAAIRKLGCGFLFAFYSNCGRTCSRLWDIQCQRMKWLWKPGYGSLKVIENGAVRYSTCDFLLVGHCKYSSILYHFRVIWRWIISWPWNRG